MIAPSVTIADLDPDAMARAVVVRDWIIREGRFIDTADRATVGFAECLMNAGLPLDRMMTAMPTLFATRRGLGRYWDRDTGVRAADFGWDVDNDYQGSPFFHAHETRDWVSFRLSEVDDSAFGVVADLREQGYTHFVCIPIFFHDGTFGGITFSTRHPDGFSEADLALLRVVEPAIAILLDLKRTSRLLHETLQMYVGMEPRDRILSGDVRLGEVHSIASAILFADMRGFTALSSRMTANQTVALLNRYFDCVVPAVEAGGGEVLKYIGDGILAIFRAGDGDPGQVTSACAAALTAAEAVLVAVDADRATVDDTERFDVKLGLHFGDVGYGNIGSGARLDFTVVGRDVNLTSRLADLAGTLDRRLVLSEIFARQVPEREFVALGAHMIRGLSDPQQVFAPVQTGASDGT